MKHKPAFNIAVTLVVALIFELIYFNTSAIESEGEVAMFSLWIPSLIAIIVLVVYLLMRWIKRPIAWWFTWLGVLAQGVFLWFMLMPESGV